MSSVKLRKEKDCLNCGHSVEEHFCPKCGQENIIVKEDAFHMVAHAIADYFHFEHKFFGTLKPLLLKPGQLTASYVAGKRVSFIHPIRLYIFISIVFFLVVLSGQGKNHESVEKKKPETDVSKLSPKQKDSLVKDKMEDVEDAMKYIPSSKLRDSITRAVRADIENGKEDVDLDFYTGKKKKKSVAFWMSKDSTVTLYEKNQKALPQEKRDGFLKHYIVKRSIELNAYPNPREKFTEDFLHNVPKMMFLLLPLFALMLKLVYINKNRYYYEHLIYSFHTHSAMFLSILATMLLQWIFGFIYDISGWLGFLCFIYIFWYIYRSLRTFYGSTRWITLLKMMFLFFCYNIVLTVCFLIVIAVSFAMV